MNGFQLYTSSSSKALIIPGKQIEKDQTVNDATTEKPLRVSSDGTAGPYIMVPVSQLDEVKRLLETQSVRYWIDENAISLNGTPEIAIINLGRDADARAVQNILDSVR